MSARLNVLAVLIAWSRLILKRVYFSAAYV